MSKRRKAGDIVRLKPNAGFILGQPDCLWIITEDGGDAACFLCDDPECFEWATLHGIGHDGVKNGGMACHVGECQMEDV